MPQPAFFGAAWLVDVVIPEVPVRQWVQSLPYRVWALSAYDPAACALVRSVLPRAVAGFYERTARRAGVPRARGGALVFVQRCESRMREIRTSGLTRGGPSPVGWLLAALSRCFASCHGTQQSDQELRQLC
jgi:hypothetical protein